MEYPAGLEVPVRWSVEDDPPSDESLAMAGLSETEWPAAERGRCGSSLPDEAEARGPVLVRDRDSGLLSSGIGPVSASSWLVPAE